MENTTTGKIRIERGIVNGYKVLIVKYNDTCADSSISRKLTGTTSETGSGIFWTYDKEITFVYGDHRRTFDFADSLSFETDSARDIQTKLIERIRLVRGWVQSVDYTEDLEFEI
jgi:hypothetical protein